MRVFSAVGRLCLKKWKKLGPYALYGLLIFVVLPAGGHIFGAVGNHRGEESHWSALVATAIIFGVFVGILDLVNESRGKKNQSLKSIDRDVRNLSERELHIAFSLIGSLIGVLVAGMFALPLLGYAISVAFFIMIGLSRKSLDKILP